MPPYQYSPLKEEVKEIRLLTLLGDTFSNEPRIIISKVPLTAENPPVFEALSYTWGTTEDSVHIKVGQSGNNTLAVTHNLAIALPYLRYKDRPRVLWIDAICIDQQNVKERGQQVERMGDIFRLADRVLVWLGPEGDSSTYALELMSALGSKIDVDWQVAAMKPALQGESNAEWADRTKPLPYGEKELLAIESLLSRSWFERLWIRQEIRLANSNALVMCGHDDMPWQTFRNAVFCLRHKRKKNEFLGSKIYSFHNRIEMIFQLSDDTTFVPFGRLVRQTKDSKCSDPRDRVYAVLSILDKSERNIGIKPDYSQTTAQVYQDVVLRFISHFRHLMIITSCEMHEEPSDMPTWVPDWSVGNVAEPLWATRACGDLSAKVEYVGNGILHAKGICSATIKHVERMAVDKGSSSEIIEAMRNAAPSDIMYGSYIGGGSMFDAYCCTLCCGTFGDWYLPPLAHFPDLQQSRATLRIMLEPRQESEADLTPGGGAAKYLDYSWNFCKGRSFFTTDEGYIGLGPEAAKPGDQICVLLGCTSPLILRRVGNNNPQYRVVGECYVHGLMNTEAFFGPLPGHIQPVLVYNAGLKQFFQAFANQRTGDVQTKDPRTDALTRKDHGIDKRHDKPEDDSNGDSTLNEVLKERGVALRVFELV